MIKTFINILLAVAFICLAAVITARFAAEARFDAAERLVAGYLWKDAEKKMNEAIKIDPYDSRYPVRLGELLFTQAGYKDNKAPLLKKAEGYYLRAIALNPRCAEYFAKLGQIYISMFIEGPDKKDYIDKAFENFNKAIKSDPNGFNTAYAVGYSGLSVWEFLTEENRKLIIDRLRYSLKLRPRYTQDVYPKLWKKTKDFKTLQMVAPVIKKDRKTILDGIRKSSANMKEPTINENDWRGASLDGGNAYSGGNMYWTGTIDAAIFIPEGASKIAMQAKGSPSESVYPFMVVELDGEEIGGAFVENKDWKEYSFDVKPGSGLKALSVTFVNDGGNKNEDRNLFIGGVMAQ